MESFSEIITLIHNWLFDVNTITLSSLGNDFATLRKTEIIIFVASE